MPEVYRKFGRTVRYENGVVVRVAEAGEAVEKGQTFSCKPVNRLREIDPIDETAIHETVRAIREIVEPPVTIERLVVSEGSAEHELGDRRWAETIRRVHLSIASGSNRAIVDLGDYDLRDLPAVARALGRAAEPRDAPPRIRLAPPVSAALLPALVGVAPPNVRLWQTASGVDGKGSPIEDLDLTAARHAVPPWPNWYRPSYRSRPLRVPFHLRAECDVKAVGEDLPRAIALLAAPDGLLLRVLCIDGHRAFPASIRVTRVDAIGPVSRWYPYGAGSFGSEMML